MGASQCALVMEGGGAREFARSSWNAKRATVVRRRRAGAPGTVGTCSDQHHTGGPAEQVELTFVRLVDFICSEGKESKRATAVRSSSGLGVYLRGGAPVLGCSGRPAVWPTCCHVS